LHTSLIFLLTQYADGQIQATTPASSLKTSLTSTVAVVATSSRAANGTSPAAGGPTVAPYRGAASGQNTFAAAVGAIVVAAGIMAVAM